MTGTRNRTGTRSTLSLALAALAAVLLLGLTGCGVGSLTSAATHSDDDYRDAEAMQKAITAITKSIGGTDPQVVEVQVSATQVSIQAIDPAKPTDLNEWDYRDGSVQPSSPIDYGSDAKALEQNLFALSSLTPSSVITFMANAKTSSKISDGTIDVVTVEHNYPFVAQVQMSATVSSDRASKTVQGSLTGKVTKVIS